MIMDVTTIPTQLKKLAKDLRERAVEVEQSNTTKCAQVLVATQGLVELENILYGDAK
jgi:predicted lipoprotein